ncbi:MAG: heparan-alpha-glucosaminide N-acetyltransferase domain-containing protein [Legionella sp.]|nr:heparan-alpha-glucosaminide N-acetyltransferase domain-containing protein [Legionella sp.]
MKQKRIPRILSLDVFRGITIMLMIIVNSPGNPKPYGWLEHAAWDGCTFADIVFPFFIMIVGVSSVLALSNLKAKNILQSKIFKKIIWRSSYIFLFGLLLNIFPYHILDWSHLRVMGVLQRIAICYFFSAILFLTTSMRTQALIALIALISYGLVPWLFSSDFVGRVDQFIFSGKHLYTKSFDPEGLMSTFPAIASALLGNLIGFLLISEKTKQKKMQYMLGLAGILLLSGWGLNFILPINKSLWSSSYVLWTTGLFLLSFSMVYGLIEIKQWRAGFKLFNLFGRHALLVYMLHVIFLKIQAIVHVYNSAGEWVSLRLYLTDVLFSTLSIQNAALAYSISYVMLWFVVLLGFEKIKHDV